MTFPLLQQKTDQISLLICFLGGIISFPIPPLGALQGLSTLPYLIITYPATSSPTFSPLFLFLDKIIDKRAT